MGKRWNVAIKHGNTHILAIKHEKKNGSSNEQICCKSVKEAGILAMKNRISWGFKEKELVSWDIYAGIFDENEST